MSSLGSFSWSTVRYAFLRKFFFDFSFVNRAFSVILASGILVMWVWWLPLVSIFAAYTREVILGTTSGQLFETAVEEKDKKEKHVKLLFELTEAPEPFIGVQVKLFSLRND